MYRTSVTVRESKVYCTFKSQHISLDVPNYRFFIGFNTFILVTTASSRDVRLTTINVLVNEFFSPCVQVYIQRFHLRLRRFSYTVPKCLHHEHAHLYRLLVSSLASQIYLAQASVTNLFNCCCLVINPTRNERFIVSFTVAIEELTILICC